jgi:antirestriction protein
LILANYKNKKMSSQAVMKRQILALAKREPSNEELQKIKQSLAVYKKLTKEEQSKINEMVKDAHAKLESEGKFAKGGTTKTQSLKTALTDLKNKVGVKKFKRATTGTDIKKDIGIPALKVGKRIVRKKGKTTNQYGTFKNQVGTTYYESRSNRSDVNQPSEKRKIKLADGGQTNESVEIGGFKRNIMGTLSFNLKLKKMRKSQDFIVYPAQEKSDYILIQSSTRFGKIEMISGEGLMSQSHANGAYAYHFQADKKDKFQLSEDQLSKLKEELAKTAGSKVGSSVIFSDNSYADKFAKGGEVSNVDYNEILPILKDKLEDAITELPNKYETSYTFNGEEVESKSRDGFIAYTDGGYEVRWFEQISYFSGSGNNLPTKALDNEMQRQVDQNYEYAKDRFKDEYSEIVEELGEENLDYNSLYEAGYESEAEQLSEWENDYDSEGTIMCEIGAYYYSPDNSRGIEDKHTIRLFGLVNLESPYHRSGNLEDRFDIDITFNSIAEMEEKLEKGLKEIIDWFDGSKYSESTKELKIVRMARGGKLRSKAKYIPNRNIDEIEVTRNGKTTSIDGANLLDGVYVKKGTRYSKGGKISKQDALQKAIDMGVDFDKDFHAQSFGNELAELAKESGYKKSPSSSGSTGRAFFYHLQKIYDKKKYAEGGELKSKAKYIPNRNIDEIEVTRNGKTTSIDGANLLDGVYVKKGTRYAKGGKMGKRSLMSVAHLVDWKGEGIKHWYTRSFPTDDLGEELNDTITFRDLWDALNEKKDIYEIIEVGDSVIRERLFEYLSLIYDVDYSIVYKKWLESSDYGYAKGGTIKKSLAEFKNKIGASKYREATRGVDIKADLQIPALKKGRRVVTTKGKTSNQYGTFKNQVGSVYYENRPNHYDVNQPSEKRKIKLADGGQVMFVKNFTGKDGIEISEGKTTDGKTFYTANVISGALQKIIPMNENKDYVINRAKAIYKSMLEFKKTDDYRIYYGKDSKYAQGGTFADGGVLEGAEIYVADLAEYNNGRLVGKHLKLSDYSSGAEVMEAIQAILDEQTAKDKYGEVHEEYAIHDFEGFPRSFYHESMGENDFDKLYEIAEVANDRGIPIDVLMEAVAHFGADEDVERVAESYYSSVRPSFGGEFKSFAMDMVDELGIEGIQNVEYYFDYDSFGSDARTDYTDEELEEYGYDDLDDTELGERLVDDMGGFDQLGKETIEGYFDYDKFGDALEYDFISVKGDDGDYYFFNRNW